MLIELRKMLKLLADWSGFFLKALLAHVDRHPNRLLATNGAVMAMAGMEILLQVKMVLSVVLLGISILLSGTTLYRKWFKPGKPSDPEI